MPKWRPVFNGTPGQGISSNIGATGRPGGDSFRTAIRCSVPDGAPAERAWLVGFSQSELLHLDGEAQTLTAWWEEETGDLVVTLWGATAGDWRRVTVAAHAVDHAGETVTLALERDADEGTLTVLQDDEALDAVETTGGTAPAWSGEIAASWLHVCGAKDQPGISAGYVGRLYDVEHGVQPRRTVFRKTETAGTTGIYRTLPSNVAPGTDPFTFVLACDVPPPEITGNMIFAQISTESSDTTPAISTSNSFQIWAGASGALGMRLLINSTAATISFANFMQEHTGKRVVFVFTREGTTAVGSVYTVDGQLIATGTTTHAQNAANITNYLKLGIGSNDSTRYTGRFYRMLLFNYALSQSEIEALIAEGLTGAGLRGFRINSAAAINAAISGRQLQNFSPIGTTGFTATKDLDNGRHAGWDAGLTFEQGRQVSYRYTATEGDGGPWASPILRTSVDNQTAEASSGPTEGFGEKSGIMTVSAAAGCRYVCFYFSDSSRTNLTVSNVSLQLLGCLLDWRFLDGSGTTVTDYSGNDVHGNITGGGSWEDVGDPFQPDPEPVLHWSLNTPSLTIADDSGNGLDGEIAGAEWSDGSTGKVGGVMPDIVDAGDLSRLPFDAGDLSVPVESHRYVFDAGDHAGLPAWFELEGAERIKRPLDGIPGTQSEDRSHVYEQPPAAETVDDYRLSVVFTSGPGTVVFRSLTPDIATVDQSGYVTGQDAGIALIEAECLGVTRTIQLEIERAVTTPSRFAVGFVEGSVARAIHDEVTSRLEGKSPATALKVFTTQNHSAGVYVRNPDCWAAGYDLTCASPWNSYGGNTRAGTLVTLRHLIWARHYDIPVGTTIRFVGMDNSVHDRVLLAKRTVPPGYGPSYYPASYVPDLVIGVLSDDLPDDKIRPATVLPADFETQIPITERITMLCLDQEEKAILQYWGGELGETSIGWIPGFYANPVLDPPLEPFWEEPIGGDSGNACGLMLPEGFCLLTVFRTQWSGSSIRYYAPVLNSLISELDAAVGISTGYQLTPANLSTYTSYV